MSDELIEIQWVCGSLDEARRISRYLVQERYVASAQILPWMEAISLLNNKLETSQETKIFLKTKLKYFDIIREVIEQNCKFEVPEITWTKIEGINPSYHDWLDESLVNDDASS